MGLAMREKSKRNDLQSEDRELPELVAQEPRVMSFDVYFSKLVATGRVQSHHKAPMRSYAEQRGVTEATDQRFEEIFRSY